MIRETRCARSAWTQRSLAWSAVVLIGCGTSGETPQGSSNQPVGTAPNMTASIPGSDAQVAGSGSDAATVVVKPGSTLDAGASASAADAATQAPSGGSSGGVSYQKNIRALMETNCLDCHTQGGIGPIPFDNWDMVKTSASLIADAVAAGIMPPDGWNEECHKLNEARSLNPDQRALFAQWKQAGFPEGNLADYVAPPVRQKKALGEPTIVMTMKDMYTPPSNADEYRCFVLDAIPNETYLTGMQIIPGQADEVHHVIIHRVENADIAAIRSLDQSDPKPGYVCNGGAGATAQNMFSYRVGSEAVTFEKGDAAYMAAGSTLIIQVHYNTVFLTDGKKATPDQTKIALWTLPAGQLPDRVVYRTTTFGPINIPANAPNIVSNISQSMGTLSTLSASLFGGSFIPGEVIGMTPHAHQLATVMNASLKRADGTSACLDEVKWDFQWQLDYMFDKGVPYGQNDTFVASCTYDNSAQNQPVINGTKQTSKAVAFGERSTDEMCEHYIWLRFPRDEFLRARGM
jgi:mono/diheme cytochrome c family protein